MTASLTDAGAGMPGELIAENANNSEEHHADPAYCSQVGLPSEEDVARALYAAMSESYGANPRWKDEPSEIKALHRKQARALLSLIRPAFEAKQRENERLRETLRRNSVWDFPRDIQHLTVKLETAEAKLAQAVEALEPFSDVNGEGDEDFSDEEKVVVKFGRTTHYALRLGDFRRARSAARGETT